MKAHKIPSFSSTFGTHCNRNGKSISADTYVGTIENIEPLVVIGYRVVYDIQDISGVREWEKELERVLFDYPVEGADDIEWDLQTYASIQEAFDESLTSDMPLLAIGIILAIVYICCTLGQFAHPIKFRISLGLLAILSILLAIIGTVGIGSMISFYGPVHQVLPLLMIAVGVDDAFVIIAAFDEPGDHKDINDRIASALSRAGPSIFVTTLTNSCAFFIGSLTEIPALKYFAYWAGIGELIFTMRLQLHGGSALLLLHAHRSFNFWWKEYFSTFYCRQLFLLRA